jgi:acetyl-CoA/propionyl-CoA carboxylase biotin carboxyl carrier protein
VGPRPGGGEAADRCGHGLRPRLELAEIARRDHDAPLQRREAEPGDQELTRNDPDDHPGRENALVYEHDEHGEDEQLVRDRVEEGPEGGGVPTPPRDPPVEPVRCHRGDEQTGRPVVVTREAPLVEGDDDGHRQSAGDRQLIGKSHLLGENKHVPFSKVLVANRGEIAIRIFRTLRELDIGAVAVYSDADRASPHVAYADEAYLLGAGNPAETYLAAERIVETARRAHAEAVHPGYGFLAENAQFARLVADAGLVWIGPPPEAIEAMGSKIAARERMRAAGVPIVPGTTEPLGSVEQLVGLGDELGWPIAIKASAGGGGKGLKVVRNAGEAERALESARREGAAYFSDQSVYVERYLEDPRHVEAQVLADAHGNVLFLGERDCTIQRRHQKLVEETPSPAVDDRLRQRIGEISIAAARAVGYCSAGTVEGLLSPEGEWFFLEMNTRIQVEHTVTEEVTGLDLVREQVLIAAGEPLSLRQEDVHVSGHAIECRINAEDVSHGFRPAPGRITAYREPAGPGVRVDSGVVAGTEISPLYDPLIAKVIVRGQDREQARRRMLRALGEFVIAGPPTLLGFHRALLSHPCFVEGATCHGVVESELLAKRAEQLSHETTRLDAAPDGAVRARTREVEVEGRRFAVTVLEPEPPWVELARRRRERAEGNAGSGKEALSSPMQGTVLAVHVAEGDKVAAGQLVCIVEAMKMENEIHSHRAGTVKQLAVAAGQPVTMGQVICVVEA